MRKEDRWLLPDGIEELLPPQAAEVESARRKLLDKFEAWGYELVVTPMVEFLDSLLTGTGSDLDLKTFKVTDQVSGRTMGIRADITPQVARMDAHSLRRDGESRLCYVGTVLHANADNMLACRAPVSIGAELFGDTAAGGDLEIVSLMLDSVASVSSQRLHVELGDVGIYRGLVAGANLDPSDERVLFDKIQGKALPDLAALLSDLNIDQTLAEKLVILPTLCGGESVIEQGKAIFKDDPEVLSRIDNLSLIASQLRVRFPMVQLNYDLSELRGYNYHTGIVFATYLGESGVRVAKGGRYDDVGSVFGRARSATGFDIDLKLLARESSIALPGRKVVEALPANEQTNERWHQIVTLRESGYMVIEGNSSAATKRLELHDGSWQLVDIQ
ncbi:MAG: ATP phosphoribosyltransferase regulatory subunit [Patiriisocius sp.]|jgi:ATP phosphoribosyltransferase regulatory subunit